MVTGVQTCALPIYDPRVVADLNEWQEVWQSPDMLLKLLVFHPPQLAQFVKGVPVITDDHPYTEFPLWRSLFDEKYSTLLEMQ